MNRVVVTGLGLVTAAGEGAGAFREALRGGAPLGALEAPGGPRGGRPGPRVARLSGFHPEAWLRPGSLRRLSEESRLLAASCLMAWRDAGAGARPIPPDRIGTFAGSGFGCLNATAAYLEGTHRDGMAGASPLLFAESLASAPVGHAAIELDARGASLALAAGDASALAALAEAWRAIRNGRLDRAVCGGFELIAPRVAGVLARLGASRDAAPHLGEGAAVLVLEEMEAARASGARILAEVESVGLAGDPAARPTCWSEDRGAWAAAHARALRIARAEPGSIAAVFRHAPPSRAAGAAETAAIDRLRGAAAGPETIAVRRVFGAYAAAGGLGLAAAVLAAAGSGGRLLVSAGSWGGLTAAAILAPPPA